LFIGVFSLCWKRQARLKRRNLMLKNGLVQIIDFIETQGLLAALR